MPKPIIHTFGIVVFVLVFLAVFASVPTARAQVGLDFLNLPPGAEIGDVLSRLYVYGVGLVAIIAVIMLVIGGVQYMVAGEKDPSSAKESIRNAIWGLILALTSYLILYTINPDLTKKVILDPIKINAVVPPTQYACAVTVAQTTTCTPCTGTVDECTKQCANGKIVTADACQQTSQAQQQGKAGEGNQCRTGSDPAYICQSGLKCVEFDRRKNCFFESAQGLCRGQVSPSCELQQPL